MRISDWSSDVCSSDLRTDTRSNDHRPRRRGDRTGPRDSQEDQRRRLAVRRTFGAIHSTRSGMALRKLACQTAAIRSEEHTSELQSLMRISYAVFCLKQKKDKQNAIQPKPNNNTS